VAEYRLRPRAIADLDEIWDYTVETWNEDQAERYLAGLHDALELLAAQPEIGRSRSDLHPGLLASNYAKHLIFYCRAAWGIDVVRVLHGSQDVPEYFRNSST
jgi:toxin ParE1/3/4